MQMLFRICSMSFLQALQGIMIPALQSHALLDQQTPPAPLCCLYAASSARQLQTLTAWAAAEARRVGGAHDPDDFELLFRAIGAVAKDIASTVSQANVRQLAGAFAEGDGPAVSAARDAPKKLDIVAVRISGAKGNAFWIGRIQYEAEEKPSRNTKETHSVLRNTHVMACTCVWRLRACMVPHTVACSVTKQRQRTPAAVANCDLRNEVLHYPISKGGKQIHVF